MVNGAALTLDTASMIKPKHEPKQKQLRSLHHQKSIMGAQNAAFQH